MSRTRRPISRRTFVAGLGAAALWLSSLLGRWRPQAPPWSIADWSDALTGVLSNRSEADALGEQYLSDHPAERDLRVLVERVRSDLRAAGPGPPAPEHLARAVRASARRSFEQDDIVVVDGWILAPIEARLCALISLSRPDSV